jgi:copper transport protein
MRLPLLGTVAAALLLAFVLGWPRTAGAHAVLERSLPVQSQQIPLADAPELVETWYSESLEKSLTSLEVLDTLGNPVHVGETLFAEGDARYAAIALPADLGPGLYTLVFQNVSTVDGHAWTGQFSFIVLNADGSVPEGTPFQRDLGAGQGYLPGVGDTTLRWLGMLAAVVMLGATAFYLFVARPAGDFLDERPREGARDAAMAIAADLVAIAAPVLALATLGQVLLLAERLGGLGTLGDIFFSTRTGELALARMGLALALATLFFPALFSRTYRIDQRAPLIVAVALVGSAGLLMTYSLSSHAGAGGGAFWAVASDFVHFAATGAWVGALLQLPLVFWWSRSRLDETNRVLYLANALDRFSWLAVVSVALLIGTGVFNGFVQLPTREALWETTYGRVLIAKLALVLPLLAIAGLNAVFLKPALVDAIDALHGEDAAERVRGAEQAALRQRLGRLQRLLPWTTAAELCVAVAVIASVAVLAQTTTAQGELREAAGQPSGEFVASDETDDLDVALSIEPFGVGLSTFTVQLAPKDGAELGEVLGVRLIATFDDPSVDPSAGVSGTRQELEPTDQPGVFSAEAALLSQPGDWRIQTRIQRRGFDDAVTNFTVPEVGGILARADETPELFDLPFTFVDWNVVAGGAMLVLGVGAFLIWRSRPPAWQGSTSASVALASVVALMAGFTLVFGVHVHTGERLVDSPKPATEESLAAGQEIFMNNCIVCHGEDGRGQGGRGADLTQHVPFHNDGTLFIWISEGIPLDSDDKRMPSFKALLTEDERWDVINFLRAAFGSGDFEFVTPEGSARSPRGPQ